MYLVQIWHREERKEIPIVHAAWTELISYEGQTCICCFHSDTMALSVGQALDRNPDGVPGRKYSLNVSQLPPHPSIHPPFPIFPVSHLYLTSVNHLSIYVCIIYFLWIYHVIFLCISTVYHTSFTYQLSMICVSFLLY